MSTNILKTVSKSQLTLFFLFQYLTAPENSEAAQSTSAVLQKVNSECRHLQHSNGVGTSLDIPLSNAQSEPTSLWVPGFTLKEHKQQAYSLLTCLLLGTLFACSCYYRSAVRTNIFWVSYVSNIIWHYTLAKEKSNCT